MSMEAVSGDIFSILRRFASPTMGGTYTNTNAPRPMPPKAKVEANTDAARVMSDPTRYGATGSDAGTGLVPQPPSSQPPQPVSTRVIPGRPPAAAPPPKPAAAPTPDVEATGAVAPPPPTDGSRATALVNAPDGAPAPAATGGIPGEMDFIYNSPLYKFMKLDAEKKKAEADRQRSMDNIFFGLSKAVGGFTGTLVETGQPGARGGNPSGDPTLTFENLKDLQGQQAAAQKDAAIRRVADQMVREHPELSRNDIEAAILAHSEKFGDLGHEFASPKARADLAKTIADTTKVGVDTDKAKQELVDPSIISDEQLIQIGRMTNQPNPTSPETIATLRSMGPQKLAGMMADVAGKAAGVAQPRAWEGKEIELKQTRRGELNTKLEQLPRLSYLSDLIDGGMNAGSLSADTVQSVTSELGYWLGIDKTNKNTQQYEAAVQQEVQQVLKAYGANASDRDREAARASLGAGVHPDVARAQLAFIAKAKIWEVARHNADIDDRANNSGMTEQNRAAILAQKVASPPPDADTLRVMDIPVAQVEALKAAQGKPNEAEMRRAFDRENGQNLSKWVLGG